MKLGVVAFVCWSLVSITGALAQCGTGTQICGTGVTGTPQTALATFSGNAPSKNSVFTVSNGTTTLTVAVCSGNCTAPTLQQLAGYFANITSGGTCASDAFVTCSGSLPAGWTSGPIGGTATSPTVLFSYSGGTSSNLTVGAAQGSTNYSIANAPSAPSLASLLGGKMVCVRNTDVPLSAANTWNNQEWHSGTGANDQLWDYKQGASSTSDPSKQIGTWSIGGANNCTVSYNYGGTPMSYLVYTNGAGYAFCGAGGGAPSFTIPATQIQGSGALQACQ